MPEPDELIVKASPYYKKKSDFSTKNNKLLQVPTADFNISYNSASESLEPIYFWILDFMGPSAKKINDNFQSSPGSGHFSELMGKATRMQEEGMKIMQTIGVLIKSVINIIYDLKQFELRLADYDAANGKKGKERIDPGIMALKQIWLDNVDIKKGNSSIKAMTFSQQGAFVTLLNAFMAAKNLEDSQKLDLNDIVKRLLAQRITEFEEWKKLSEDELIKRYNIERHWLKSQVASLKLYSKWATPYFKAAEDLRMMTEDNAALVKAFNTIALRLTLFKADKIKVSEEVWSKSLPKIMEKLKPGSKGKGDYRDFYACTLVDFRFRGIPQKVEQHYGFGGKSDVSFKAFALNQEELDLFYYLLKKSDLNESLKLVETVTGSSLKEIEKDIEHFTLEVKDREQVKNEEKEKEDVNPFSALLGLNKLIKKEDKKKEEKLSPEQEKELAEKKEKEKAEKLMKKMDPDNYYEKLLRTLAEFKAYGTCYGVYDIYKKAHGMASVPFGDLMKRAETRVKFGELFEK